MPLLLPLQSALRCCLPATLAILMLTSCESDRARRGPDGPPAPDKAVPEMEAHGTFFAGQVEVETLLNATGFAGRDGAADGGASGGSPGGGGGGARGGGHRHGGGSGEPSMSGTASDGGPAPRLRPSNMAAVRLHLRLTNHRPIPIEVEVVDFDSDLGDFVVEPPKMSLPSNKPVEAEPMTSRLGVESDAIPLTISLRVDGKTEKQVLVLKLIKADVPPGPAPAGQDSR